MQKIIVFRLENDNGIGPFRGGHRNEANRLKEHFGIALCLSNYMKPRMFKKHAKNGWICGWSSEKTFCDWMNGQEDYFKELGYSKVIYEAKNYRLCGNQELFYYDSTIKDYISCSADGYQVFFNPHTSLKIN